MPGSGLRCATCHAAREAAEARRFGWQRLGPCPSGRPNYRLYRHRCGHVQRVAQANMLWGQCDCAGCGQGWSARPSFLYLFEIHLPARGQTYAASADGPATRDGRPIRPAAGRTVRGGAGGHQNPTTLSLPPRRTHHDESR